MVEGVVRTRHSGNVRNRPKTEKGVRSIDLPEVAVEFLHQHRVSLETGPESPDLEVELRQ